MMLSTPWWGSGGSGSGSGGAGGGSAGPGTSGSGADGDGGADDNGGGGGGGGFPVLVIQDLFDGSSATQLTSHSPDTAPVGMVWTNTYVNMRLSGSGYAYGFGSSGIDTLASKNSLGNSVTPVDYGLGTDLLITIDWSMGTSNAPQTGGFAAVGLEGQLYINDVSFAFQIRGNASPNEWRMMLGPIGNVVTIATPSANTNYTMTLDIVGDEVTMTYGIYTLTHTFSNAIQSGLNAIELACSSRTGGGIHYRELNVSQRS